MVYLNGHHLANVQPNVDQEHKREQDHVLILNHNTVETIVLVIWQIQEIVKSNHAQVIQTYNVAK